ncbi:MAG TPA: hypothetical protein DCE44_14690 [Verrucomicrobiales bacterium]|nr:hypothetical protein [Verrucomicrobiales bacterium]
MPQVEQTTGPVIQTSTERRHEGHEMLQVLGIVQQFYQSQLTYILFATRQDRQAKDHRSADILSCRSQASIRRKYPDLAPF